MHNVNQRNFATTAEAARYSEGQEALRDHGIDPGPPRNVVSLDYPSLVDPSTADDRRFSQAPPAAATVEALLGSITTVEAIGTVLDLSFLVDDVSPEEAAARNLVAAIVASAARIIKSNLDQGQDTYGPDVPIRLDGAVLDSALRRLTEEK